MTTEEARKYVDELIQQAQEQPLQPSQDSPEDKQPRIIEIVSDDEDSSKSKDKNVETLRKQVQSLQEELRKLKD
jgi:polyhydroxyalkanoate synthesis regulator phasin